MGRSRHLRHYYPVAKPWLASLPTTVSLGTLTFTGQPVTSAVSVTATVATLTFTGMSGYTSPVTPSAGSLVLTGQPAMVAVSTAATVGALVLTGQATAVVTSVTAAAGAFTLGGFWATPVAPNSPINRVYPQVGTLSFTGNLAIGVYHPKWRMIYEPMIYEAQLIRSRVAPGEEIVWRLWIERATTEGGVYIPVTATVPADISLRSFMVELSGDSSMANHRANNTYTGNLTETVYIGPRGGAVAFTFTDLPQRTISDGVVTIPSTIDTVNLAVYPNVSSDAFERRGSLSGELVLQKLMQVENH